MKRVSVLVMIFMLAMASPALAADIKMGGEFEAAGICQRNFDFDSNVDEDTRTWAGVLVLSLEAAVAENISVFASYTLVDGTWGDAKYDTDSGFSNASGAATDDVAYAVVGLDSFTVTAGRQLDEWGHMLMAGGDGIDRFTVSKALGGFEHALFTDKIEEKDQGDLKDDLNRYGLQISRESDEQGMGLYLWHAMGNGIVNTAGTITSEDMSGYGMDIYYRGEVGPVSLSAELAYQSGDAELDPGLVNVTGWGYGKDSYDKSRMGFFLTAGMEMEPMTLSGTLAYAKNSFTAGDYFTPTFMTGLDQDTAYYNFGEHLAGSTEGDTAMLIALGLDYGITDKWTLGAKVAQHTFADDAGLEGTEVDLMAEYEINEGATWGLYVAQLSPDGFKAKGVGEDDAAMSVVQSLAIEF
jgi:hypothetical protein